MFRSRNKEHESNKNALPCLLDTLSVFLWRTLPISALFQCVVGSLFSLSIFILRNYIYDRETVELKLSRIALKRPEMLRTYHK